MVPVSTTSPSASRTTLPTSLSSSLSVVAAISAPPNTRSPPAILIVPAAPVSKSADGSSGSTGPLRLEIVAPLVVTDSVPVTSIPPAAPVPDVDAISVESPPIATSVPVTMMSPAATAPEVAASIVLPLRISTRPSPISRILAGPKSAFSDATVVDNVESDTDTDWPTKVTSPAAPALAPADELISESPSTRTVPLLAVSLTLPALALLVAPVASDLISAAPPTRSAASDPTSAPVASKVTAPAAPGPVEEAINPPPSMSTRAPVTSMLPALVEPFVDTVTTVSVRAT